MIRDVNHRSPLVWRILRIAVWTGLSLASYGYHALSVFVVSAVGKCGGSKSAMAFFNWLHTAGLLFVVCWHTADLIRARGDPHRLAVQPLTSRRLKTAAAQTLLVNQLASSYLTYTVDLCSSLDTLHSSTFVAFLIVHSTLLFLAGVWLVCKLNLTCQCKSSASDAVAKKFRSLQRAAFSRLLRRDHRGAVALLLESEQCSPTRPLRLVSDFEVFAALCFCSTRLADADSETRQSSTLRCPQCDLQLLAGQRVFEFGCCHSRVHASCLSRSLVQDKPVFEASRLLRSSCSHLDFNPFAMLVHLLDKHKPLQS